MSEGQETPAGAERAFIPVRIAVMTVSDTRTLETDRSGQPVTIPSSAMARFGPSPTGRKSDVGLR